MWILLIVAVGVPLIILAATATCMALHLKCCSGCQILLCGLCSAVLAVVSLVLIIVSFANSAVQRVTSDFQNNAAKPIDSIMKRLGNNNSTVQLYTQDMNYLVYSPSPLVIKTTSTKDLFDSIRFNLTFNGTIWSNGAFKTGVDSYQTFIPNIFKRLFAKMAIQMTKLF